MFTQARAVITGLIILALLIIAGLIYWRGSSNATTKAALTDARGAIIVERKTAAVERKTDEIVNRQTQQTNYRAQEADREIQELRSNSPAPTATRPAFAGPAGPASAGAGDPPRAVPDCDVACARIVQLAREARAAALESGARLQSTRAGAR